MKIWFPNEAGSVLTQTKISTIVWAAVMANQSEFGVTLHNISGSRYEDDY